MNNKKGEGKFPKSEPRSSPSKKVTHVPREGKAAARSAKPLNRKFHTFADPHWRKAAGHLALIRKGEEKRSHRTVVLDDDGEPVDPLAEAMASAASIFTNPNVTYTFRLVSSGFIGVSAGVQTFGRLTWDPSAAGLNIAEYVTYLIYLFNQVRLRHVRLNLVPLASNNDTQNCWAVCSDLGLTATNPTSVSQVVENPNSRICNAYPNNVRGHTIDVDVPNTVWASVNTPVAVQDAGAYGEFMFCQYGLASSNNGGWGYLFEGTYEFRSRS